MAGNSVNYDRCAGHYEQRYACRSYPNIRRALSSFAHQPRVERVLEVGCGTGHWLREVQQCGLSLLGVDPSTPMLQEVRVRAPGIPVVCARAEGLPFADHVFDLLFCVNAFHHFEQPHRFLSEASRVLRQGGRVAIIGLDPHEPDTDWYLYRYFRGTYVRDLHRYKAPKEIATILDKAGFHQLSAQQVERLTHTFTGDEVLADPFLKKDSTSQLELLSDSEYFAGLRRIRAAIHQATARREQALFRVQLSLSMVSGSAPCSGPDGMDF